MLLSALVDMPFRYRAILSTSKVLLRFSIGVALLPLV